MVVKHLHTMCHGLTINIVAPPEDAELFERIAANGAVITQFAFNRPADKQSYSRRATGPNPPPKRACCRRWIPRKMRQRNQGRDTR